MTDSSKMRAHLEIMQLAATSAAFTAAAETGLLAALEPAARTAEALAEATACDAFATARVLDVLVETGVVERSDQGYALGPLATPGFGDPITDLARAGELWARLPDYLRDGRGAHFHGRAPQPRGVYADVVQSLGRLMHAGAAELAAHYPQRARPPRHILDIGAGSGVWSLAMAALLPEVTVTAFDLPPVLGAFEREAASAGLAARVATHAGDYHQDLPLQARFDRVLLGNVVHLEPPEQAATLVARAGECVAQGGDLVLIDVPAGPGTAARKRAAAYGLHLALRSGRGQVHTQSMQRAWLADAGFVQYEEVPLAAADLVAIIARRAAGQEGSPS